MKIEKTIKTAVFSISAIIIATLLIMNIVLKINTVVALISSFIFVVLLLVVLYSIDAINNESRHLIEKSLDASVREALTKGSIGIAYYNDEYEITWMSDFFDKKQLNHLNEKLLTWLPELKDLIEDSSSSVEVKINDDTYEVTKMDKYSILTFKEITNETKLQDELNGVSYVLGLLSFDNVDETSLAEDDIFNINVNFKAPVVEYFKSKGVAYATLRNNKLLLILNEKIFEIILSEHFQILNQIRKVAKDFDLPVSLSMSFARGGNDYSELYLRAEQLINLAQTRGGDQVVVGNANGDTLYFGGTSEAREKQSKTKVRVILRSLKDLINKSDNVLIIGHKEADSDCIGSMIAMSNIVSNYGKNAYLVTKTGGIEPMIADVLSKYNDVLGPKHNFVNETEADNIMSDNSLVIMLDHHMSSQSSSQLLVNKAKKVVIIDHHRRKANLDTIPLLSYIEPSASSSCEVVSEFLPFVSHKTLITPQEANLLYLGILIDTDHFRVRTGVRTFEVCKILKGYGADSTECENIAAEPYENIVALSSIINNGKKIRDNVVVAAMNEKTYFRTTASQACDTLVKSKGIDAAFVICNDNKNETLISARSTGIINVQVIMEKMGGGGHLTAAGLQVNDSSVAKLEAKLLTVLDEYFKEN